MKSQKRRLHFSRLPAVRRGDAVKEGQAGFDEIADIVIAELLVQYDPESLAVILERAYLRLRTRVRDLDFERTRRGHATRKFHGAQISPDLAQHEDITHVDSSDFE